MHKYSTSVLRAQCWKQILGSRAGVALERVSWSPGEGRQRSWERHQLLLHSLPAKEPQLQALHSQKCSSKALEAATYPFPEQGQQPKREVGLS